MTTTIDTIRPHGIRTHKHGLTAVLVGAVLAVGAVATTAVVTADGDSTPARTEISADTGRTGMPNLPTDPASMAAAGRVTVEDPLVSRFGQPLSPSADDFVGQQNLQLSGPR